MKHVAILAFICLILLLAPSLAQQTATDWLNEGQRLVDQGKYEEALQAYDKGIRLDPQWTDLYYHKGTAYSKLGMVDESVNAFDVVNQINPRDGVVAYYWMGRVLSGAGRNSEAVQAYERSTQSFDTYGEWYPGQKSIAANAWYNQGLALDALGRSNEAQNAYKKAIELNPSLTIPASSGTSTEKGTDTSTTTKNQVGQVYPQTMTVSHKHELLWPAKLEKISEKDCVGYYRGTNYKGMEAEASVYSLSSGEVEIDITVKEEGSYNTYVGKPNDNIIEGEYTPSEGFELPDYFKAEMSSTIGECHVEAPSTKEVPCSCPEGYKPKIENGVCIACCKENGGTSTTYDYDMDVINTCVKPSPTKLPTSTAKDCNEYCMQEDSICKVWNPLNGYESPNGPNLCTCDCKDNCGYDDAYNCQPCPSFCNAKGAHIVWSGNKVSGTCYCVCDATNGWYDDGRGNCKADCNAYCSDLAPHKVWDQTSSAPSCKCKCDPANYRDDGTGTGQCAEKIEEPAKKMESYTVLGDFITKKLHYMEQSCQDWQIAPAGAIIIWDQPSQFSGGNAAHATVILSNGNQIGMHDFTAVEPKVDPPKHERGSDYKCRTVYYPPSTASTRLLDLTNTNGVVSKYTGMDRYVPNSLDRTTFLWDCWGFAANVAYELFGGKPILNP